MKLPTSFYTNKVKPHLWWDYENRYWCCMDKFGWFGSGYCIDAAYEMYDSTQVRKIKHI